MNKRSLTQEQFLVRAKAKHGDTYDYSEVNYQGYLAKIQIGCRIHGQFSMTVGNHLSGKACRKCGCQRLADDRKNTIEEFVNKSLVVHGDKYDYSKVEYKNLLTKVVIVCSMHGDFQCTPGNHMFGKGCPRCAKYGFQSAKSAFFYILEAGNLTKIGITNRPVEDRLSELNRDGKKFTLLASRFFENGQDAKDLESASLAVLRAKYVQPEDKFDGSTECFVGADADWLAYKLLTCQALT